MVLYGTFFLKSCIDFELSEDRRIKESYYFYMDITSFKVQFSLKTINKEFLKID